MARQPLGHVLHQIRHLIDSRSASELTDAELLDHFLRRRDEQAFEALVRRHGPMVLGVCRRRLNDPDEVEDAFQATFLVLLRRARGIGRRELLGNWLYSVANRIALRARACSARRRSRQREITDVPAADRPCRVLGKELRGVLDEEVGRLPAKYRAPLLLCYLEGKTNDEAARVLGWPRGTVATRLARARRALRVRLLRRGVALSAGALAVRLVAQAPAAVPDPLVAAAVKAGRAAAAGKAVASAKAAALTEGVMRDLFLIKLKAVAAVLVAVGVLGSGAGLLCYRALAAKPADDPPEALAADQPAPRKDAAPKPPDRADVKKPAEPPPEKKDKPDAKQPADPPPEEKKVEGAKPAAGWAEQKTFQPYKGSVECLALAPDGKLVALAGSNAALGKLPDLVNPNKAMEELAVQLWDTATGKQQTALLPDGKGGMANVICVQYAPDGKALASVDATGKVFLWDAAKGKLRTTLPPDGSHSYRVAFAPDSKVLAVARYDGTVRLYDAATGKAQAVLRVQQTMLSALGFTADGKAVITAGPEKNVGGEGAIKVWEAATGKLQATSKADLGKVNNMVLSPDGKTLAAGCWDGRIRLWEAATGKLQATLEGSELAFVQLTVAFAPDGKTLACGDPDGVVALWDLAARKEQARLKGHPGRVSSLAFAADGRTLASADDKGTVRVLALKEGSAFEPVPQEKDKEASPGPGPWKEHAVLKMPKAGGAIAVAFSPDGGSLAYGGADGLLKLWDVAAAKERAALKGHRGHVIALKFAPDGTTLTSVGFDGTVKVWDLATHRERSSQRLGLTDLMQVAWSADGKLMATCAGNIARGQEKLGGQVQLWEMPAVRRKAAFQAHEMGANSLAFSPDGKTLVTTGSALGLGSGPEDCMKLEVKLWDVATAKGRATLEVNSGLPVFAPDGKTLALATYDPATKRNDLKLFDPATAKERASFPLRKGGAGYLAYSPDGRALAAAGMDRAVHLYDAATGKEVAVLKGHTDMVQNVVFAPDGKALASTGPDGTVRLWVTEDKSPGK